MVRDASVSNRRGLAFCCGVAKKLSEINSKIETVTTSLTRTGQRMRKSVHSQQCVPCIAFMVWRSCDVSSEVCTTPCIPPLPDHHDIPFLVVPLPKRYRSQHHLVDPRCFRPPWRRVHLHQCNLVVPAQPVPHRYPLSCPYSSLPSLRGPQRFPTSPGFFARSPAPFSRHS